MCCPSGSASLIETIYFKETEPKMTVEQFEVLAPKPWRYCCDHKTGTGRTLSTTHAGKDPAESV